MVQWYEYYCPCRLHRTASRTNKLKPACTFKPATCYPSDSLGGSVTAPITTQKVNLLDYMDFLRLCTDFSDPHTTHESKSFGSSAFRNFSRDEFRTLSCSKGRLFVYRVEAIRLAQERAIKPSTLRTLQLISSSSDIQDDVNTNTDVP